MKIFLLRMALAAVGPGTASPETEQWFQATEQALMDALAPGNKAVWERIMDPSCVVTTEEGQVLTREQFLDEFGPLPEGLWKPRRVALRRRERQGDPHPQHTQVRAAGVDSGRNEPLASRPLAFRPR